MAQLDAEDAATAAALTGLRTACVQAKETLSADTVTTVEVKLPGITAKVRLTRSEFETMISAALESTVDVLDSVLDSADLTAADVDCVLVSGGSSRIPLVTQLLSRQFHRPVLAPGADPATAIAAGAVLALGEIPATPVSPVVQAAKGVAKEVVSKAAKPTRKSKAVTEAPLAPAAKAPVAPAAPAKAPPQLGLRPRRLRPPGPRSRRLRSSRSLPRPLRPGCRIGRCRTRRDIPLPTRRTPWAEQQADPAAPSRPAGRDRRA